MIGGNSFLMVLEGGGRGRSLLTALPKNKELFLDPLEGGSSSISDDSLG
jgi:hypothetical protein